MEKDYFKDSESIKKFTKESVFQLLNFEKQKLTVLPHLFKDFPNEENLRFGMLIGMGITSVRMLGKQYAANPELVDESIRVAMEEIHDELKIRYEDLE